MGTDLIGLLLLLALEFTPGVRPTGHEHEQDRGAPQVTKLVSESHEEGEEREKGRGYSIHRR
jgi:hypothetical protein